MFSFTRAAREIKKQKKQSQYEQTLSKAREIQAVDYGGFVYVDEAETYEVIADDEVKKH